ncbi:ABC transporter permease [Rufibacter glacialis]|uniref:ABC transporter permease n=1 Tax=Rufibacter glacialis TaxID=1259555 RepID=A0A5M8Q887_9BACT|nr:ABC transporter permease [Rufibacter glacialis]KAA6431040.1 FtsX-like permease family protein [Rufibacter glacialis]GGK83500.1 ABC transporter permease [Rufibacter glacialis]
MLKNYIKIAWAVLKRRKFFTFISLFGISFTLMVLMVVTSLFDHAFGPQMPERQTERLLFVNMMREQGEQGYSSSGPPSYYFLDRYVKKLQTPEKVSINSVFTTVNSYVNNQKLTLDLKHTDRAFWEILDFEFLEGRAFTQQEVANASHVAVINQNTRQKYFGDAPAIGQRIEVNQVKYTVVGVVKDVPVLRLNSYSDVWVPITLRRNEFLNDRLRGSFFAIIQARKPGDLPKIKEEYARMMTQVEIKNPKDVSTLYSFPDTILETFARTTLGGRGENSNVGYFYTLLALAAFLFMLLPTINLVNINISRIMERSSEIGVRKAFGASSKVIIGQFVVENVFLTLIGGLLGLAFSLGVMHLINNSGVIAYADLGLNVRVFAWGLLLCLVFGLISGVYPAYKMSRLHAVEALRGGSK